MQNNYEMGYKPARVRNQIAVVITQAAPNHARVNPAIALWLRSTRLAGRVAELESRPLHNGRSK